MKTMVGTPEADWKPVYGVLWGCQVAPLCDYDDLKEAQEVAQVVNGQVMVRWEARTDWGLL